MSSDFPENSGMSAVIQKIRQFFFPSLTRAFLLRVSIVAFSTYLFLGYLCTPIFVQGKSMEPTYHHRTFNFCWRLRYISSKPKRNDVVMVRFAGTRVMLLKRVVALEGEWVEFRKGRLHVDGREVHEPYVRYPGNWNLSPRQVEKDCVYVVGDNRSTPIEDHHFGQTPLRRIMGGPLW
jgi:signal peptidase I